MKPKKKERMSHDKQEISSVPVELCDHMGRPVEPPEPPMSAHKLRQYYLKGMARVGLYDEHGNTGDHIREGITRAQIPQVVHLLVYDSKFQIEPTRREYLVYAPQETQKAAELVIRLWQRWERPPREEFTFGDMREQYPKFDDAVFVEPIDDETFDAHWKDAKKRPHKAAGDPDDPFAFTCLDQDVRLWKAEDFQEGYAVTI